MANSLLPFYFNALNGLIVATALVILVSGLDDLFIDVCFWSSEFVRRVINRSRGPSITAEDLRAREERWFAIMVPAWQEAEVIAHMIENTLETLDYSRYVVFLGTYQNDAATKAEADKMVARDPKRIRQANVEVDGPTSKADCLNWILRSMAACEKEKGIRFAGVLMHDCEDVIHPLELKYFNHQIDDYDLIQLPVMSLDLKGPAWVAGTYLDDFSEVHQKDMVVREMLTSTVPGAGVALCYNRNAIAAMMEARGGRVFNTATLTEDYDFSFRLADLGFKRQHFARFPITRQQRQRLPGMWWQRPATASGLLATCEYFPSEFQAAYRQRARWILGISFLGWQQLKWSGSLLNKYMLFRDRKGIVTAPFSVIAYFVLANTLAVSMLDAPHGASHPAARLVIFAGWMRPILFINIALLANRLVERVYFVSRLNGVQQGLLSVPRTVFNNFINFAAVSRAWHQYIRHLITGVPIAWDKTKHTFPTTAELVRHRRRLGDLLVERGVITAADLESAMSRQRTTGVRLGAALLADGRLTPERLADAIAEQDELPRILRDTGPQLSLANAIPAEMIRRHGVVPFARSGGDTLQVAVAARPDSGVTQRLRATTGLHVAYVVACDHEVAKWVADAAPEDVEAVGRD
jgi:adsorption protein B